MNCNTNDNDNNYNKASCTKYFYLMPEYLLTKKRKS